VPSWVRVSIFTRSHVEGVRRALLDSLGVLDERARPSVRSSVCPACTAACIVQSCRVCVMVSIVVRYRSVWSVGLVVRAPRAEVAALGSNSPSRPSRRHESSTRTGADTAMHAETDDRPLASDEFRRTDETIRVPISARIYWTPIMATES
jgi:hypothetical protein